MKQYPIYEVQSFGVTIEIDKSFKVADAAYGQASDGHGRTVLYRLDPATAKKSIVKSK